MCKFTPAQLAALDVLATSPEPLTYYELREAVFKKHGEYLHSSQLSGLSKRGMVGHAFKFPTTDDAADWWTQWCKDNPEMMEELPEALKDLMKIIERAEEGDDA